MSAMDPLALAALRRSYSLAGLAEEDVAAEPFAQFERWLADAVAAELREPNAMVLATASGDGIPSARTVLLKGLSDGERGRGLVFFTNYESRKGQQLAANPHASLLFVWVDLERQVGFVGDVERLTPHENDAYFATRPHGSKLGALASQQTRVIDGRGPLERRYAELSDQYPEGSDVPRPDSWGGFRLVPVTVEFWQGRSNRLHDRLLYRRDAAELDVWAVERLSP
jgi:pyridoxamine 5'-phosphate oxidase